MVLRNIFCVKLKWFLMEYAFWLFHVDVFCRFHFSQFFLKAYSDPRLGTILCCLTQRIETNFTVENASSYQTIQAVEYEFFREIEISGNKMQRKTFLQKHARKGFNLISNHQFLTMLFILKTMGRDKRLEYAASFQNCYFFRLLYYAGTQYPIMGALR